MKNTAERRQLILEVLCERRRDTLENLACEFGVSKRTIQYDVEILSCSYPLYTVTGTYGGIYVAEGFRLGMKYLTDKQYELLNRLSENLTGEDIKTMRKILKTFAFPKGERNEKKPT